MKTARKVSTRTTHSRPQPRPMADVSAMVWFPWPEDWPLPTAEAMAEDARRRARFYGGSKFWRDAMTVSAPKPAVLKQRELF